MQTWNEATTGKICTLCIQHLRSIFIFKKQAEKSFKLFSDAVELSHQNFSTIHSTNKIHEDQRLNNTKTDENLNNSLITKIFGPSDKVYTCDFCHRIFVNKVALLKHDFDCLHDCAECGLSFDDEKIYTAHFLIEHNINLNSNDQVQNCNNDGEIETFTKKDFIRKFMKKRDDGRTRCQVCFSSMLTKGVSLHLRNVHSVIKTLKCPFCRENFFTRTSRVRHVSTKHPKNYRCEKCCTQFVKYDNIVKHALMIHGKPTRVKMSPLEVADLRLDDDTKFVPKRSMKKKATKTVHINPITMKTRRNSVLNPPFTSEQNVQCPTQNSIEINKETVNDNHTTNSLYNMETQHDHDNIIIKLEKSVNNGISCDVSSFF